MNYFAHGIRFIDRPYFLAGTAVPDWLSVVDRKVRMRARRVEPVANDPDTVESEVARGVLQHLRDDQWFHRTRAFVETMGEVTQRFKSVLGTDDGFRPAFLSHIATELLLDAVLIERHPDELDRYYGALAEVETDAVQDAVNRMAANQTFQLSTWIPKFIAIQFLRDYTDSARLLYRLNQVMQRIKLKRLSDETLPVLEAAREIVADRIDELLSPDKFESPEKGTPR